MPGVRRELILAFRNLPTDQVGEALKTLARTWDGQDRWYLEALGLALEGRESAFLAEVFDGTLYGDLDLENAGKAGQVALPPYFPVDRNEAYIAAGDKPPPGVGAEQDAGPRLAGPPARGPAAARADHAPAGDPRAAAGGRRRDPADGGPRSGGRHGGPGPADERPRAEAAGPGHARPEARRRRPGGPRPREGRRGDRGRPEGARPPGSKGSSWPPPPARRAHAGVLAGFAEDAKAPSEVREAAIEALGRLQPSESRALMDRLIGEVEGEAQLEPGRRGRRARPSPGAARRAGSCRNCSRAPSIRSACAARPCGRSPSAATARSA